MLKTISLTADVPFDRQVQITLPDDVPPGPAEIVLVVVPHAQTRAPTLGDLLHSEFFGMWRDRDDIQDSIDFARKLRVAAWSRAA